MVHLDTILFNIRADSNSYTKAFCLEPEIYTLMHCKLQWLNMSHLMTDG